MSNRIVVIAEKIAAVVIFLALIVIALILHGCHRSAIPTPPDAARTSAESPSFCPLVEEIPRPCLPELFHVGDLRPCARCATLAKNCYYREAAIWCVKNDCSDSDCRRQMPDAPKSW